MSDIELRERVEFLEAENAYLRGLLAVPDDAEFIQAARRQLGLTRSRARLLHIMLRTNRQNKLALFHIYYGADEVERDPKLIDIMVHYIRGALKPYGIAVKTIWGDGYRIEPEDRPRVYDILGLERPGSSPPQEDHPDGVDVSHLCGARS